MKPLVVDWAKQQGKIDPSYKPEQATSEFVANIIGDAFADPEFWATVRQKDFGLFKRMLAAVQEWFDTIMDHVSEWGTQAPDVIKDLQGMRELIASAIEQAQAGPEAVAAGEAGAHAAAPRAEDKPYLDAVERGDMEAAQRMVDKAAVANNYGPERWVHDTLASEFKVFKVGGPRYKGQEVTSADYWKKGISGAAIWFRPEGGKGLIAHQVEKAGPGKTRRSVNVYLQMLRPLWFDAANRKELREEYGVSSEFPAIIQPSDVQKLKSKGFDSVVYFSDGKVREAAVFDPEQAKSSDPVTYDARGNVIPLSQRFNPEKKEIVCRATRRPQVRRAAHARRAKATSRRRAGQATGHQCNSTSAPQERRGAQQDGQADCDDVIADVLSRRLNLGRPTEHVKERGRRRRSSARTSSSDAKEGEKPSTKSVAKWQKQNYRFDQIPEGMTREQWAKELGGRIMTQWLDRMKKGFAPGATKEQRAGAQLILDEIEWYRSFTGRLREEFGGFADLMADFLGAYSPRQNVKQNWRNAIDSIWALSTGKYDQLFSELDAYLKADPAHTIGTWRKQGGATMTSRNGALFGTNTERGMSAALGLWREIKFGDKPKAKNFTRNLIALSIRATIDVWAARLLDRVAGKPRIPVDAEGAVSGEHISEKELWKKFGPENLSASTDLGNLPIKGQFAFGQEVFEDVAARMRDPASWVGSGLSAETIARFSNVTAADVQATNWFVEKEIWTENNWTNDEGSGGSFMFEINQMLGARFQIGLAQQISEVPGVENFLPQNPEQARFAQEVRDDLSKLMPDAIALRVMDSLGMFQGKGERTLDTEWVHGPGMEPNDVIRAVLYHAWSKDQAATHISRVITNPEEDISENARPGIEVMFKADVDLSAINAVIAARKEQDQRFNDGRTRVRSGAQRFLGVRFHHIPEYAGDGGKNWGEGMVIRGILRQAERELMRLSGVADAHTMLYDTLVFEKGKHYDAEGIHPGGVGTVEARSWRRRYFDAVAQEAVRRDGEQAEAERDRGPAGEGQQVSGGERVQEGLEGPTLPVTVFDSDLMEFAPLVIVATTELLRKL
jgi:hypothetical protein